MALPICRVSGPHGENVQSALANFRMYGLPGLPKGIHPLLAGCPWMSKQGCYENPFAVTGGKATLWLDTDLEEAPKRFP